MPTVNLEVTDQRREDMLVGALEGGSNGWYLIDNEAYDIIDKYIKKDEEGRPITPLAEAMWLAIKDGNTIPIHDIEGEEGKLGEINLESIIKGEQIMADNFITNFMDLYLETDDAETADIWFQLAVMGEVPFS